MPHMSKSDMDYEVDEAVRTLVRAEAIRADKKLFAKVKPALAKKLKETQQATLHVKVAQKQAEIRERS